MLIGSTADQRSQEFGSCSTPSVSTLGLQMGNKSKRTAVSLCFGALLCVSHTCPHSGMDLDHSGVHGLSTLQKQSGENTSSLYIE